jgi:hypothetical protein
MAKRKVGIKLTVWLPTTKRRKSTRFPCMKVACNILLESFQWGIQFCFRPHCNWRFAHKIMGPKIARVPTLGIFRFPFGSPGTKCHLDVGLMERWKVYYKGEGDGFPKSRPWWVLWVRICLWFVLAPKVLQLCTNQLVVYFVQIRVSDEVLVILLSPIPDL